MNLDPGTLAASSDVLPPGSLPLFRADELPVAPGLRAWIGRRVLDWYDWRVEGGKPATRQAVVVAAPHTSNWDLVFTLAIAWSLGIEVRWVGKHTLFKPPFGGLMRTLGGIAVDRRKRSNAVDAIAEVFKEHPDLLLVVPPEGTRGHTDRWKTGFYWIAVKAEVPVILGFLDYARKVGGLGTVFTPCGDLEQDAPKLERFYGDVKGKFPDLQAPPRIVPDRPAE